MIAARPTKCWRRCWGRRIAQTTTWCGHIGKARTAPRDFDQFWQTALYQGLIADTALSPKSVSLQHGIRQSTAQPKLSPAVRIWKLSSGPILPSGMVVLPIMAGCKNYPNRSPN